MNGSSKVAFLNRHALSQRLKIFRRFSRDLRLHGEIVWSDNGVTNVFMQALVMNVVAEKYQINLFGAQRSIWFFGSLSVRVTLGKKCNL